MGKYPPVLEREEKSPEEVRKMAAVAAGYGGYVIEVRPSDGSAGSVMLPCPASAFHDQDERRRIGDLLYEAVQSLGIAMRGYDPSIEAKKSARKRIGQSE